MHARTALPAVAVLLAAAAMTGCSSTATPHTDAASAVDCSNPNIDPADKAANCTGPSTPAPAKAVHLGTAARTAGALHPLNGPGGGTLELTPAAIVYTRTGNGYTSANGTFAVIAIKARSIGTTAANQAAPADGGGWSWITPAGQTLEAGNGEATSVPPNDYMAAGPYQPGAFAWTSEAFDLTAAQRGGTLQYIDGAGKAWRWTMPKTNAGPQAAKLKTALAQ
jgi:hypothetical protein